MDVLTKLRSYGNVYTPFPKQALFEYGMPVDDNTKDEYFRQYRGYPSRYREVKDFTIAHLQHLVLFHNLLEFEEIGYRVIGRIKTPEDVFEKVERPERRPEGLPQIVSLDQLESEITDIVGVRVILDYRTDVFRFVEILNSSPAWTEAAPDEDYINLPQPNGYRSYHLLKWVPTKDAHPCRCEIQVRTENQDSWATKTHKLVYRKRMEAVNQSALSGLMSISRVISDLLDCCDVLADEVREGIRRIS